MPIPKSILLDVNHDLDVTHGVSLTPDLPTYVRQKILMRLRFFLGEWYLDRRQGVPYFEKVFVDNPDIPFLSSLYRRIILGTRGVGGLESRGLRFDKTTRTLFVSYVARIANSLEKVTVVDEPFVLQSPEEEAV